MTVFSGSLSREKLRPYFFLNATCFSAPSGETPKTRTPKLRKGRELVVELTGLLGAPGSVVGRVEVEHEPIAEVVLQRDRLSGSSFNVKPGALVPTSSRATFSYRLTS